MAHARGQSVSLEDLSVKFGDFTAVHPTNLTVKDGEFFSILGPSGCGKTTILKTISGFLEPSRGKVLIGGKDMAGLRANRRPTAMIFQSLALFPLMNVRDNVAFGLEARGVGRGVRLKRADELLELVALTGQGDKRPGELSGGQRQRVAIARALAVDPEVLLLDEPLSALDLKLRQHMRAELRSIQQKTGVTFIYITHDQGEALAMSDRLAVMNEGRIQQVATPREVYHEPQNAFVASFVGASNILPARVVQIDGAMAELTGPFGSLRARAGAGLEIGQDAYLFVRPEQILITDVGERAGRVDNISMEGAQAQITINDGTISWHAEIPGRSNLSIGQNVRFVVDAEHALALPKSELAASIDGDAA